MTYSKPGYVLSVMKDKQTLKEVDGTVRLAYNTEYQLRLRNRTRTRACVDVYIDGRAVILGYVVPANGFVDLKRFVEGKDLNKGPKLRFVPLSDGKIEDKGEPDMGVVEARFYPEKERVQLRPIVYQPLVHHCHTYHCWSCGCYHCSCSSCFRPVRYWNEPIFGGLYTVTSSSSGHATAGSACNSSSTIDMNLALNAQNVSFTADANTGVLGEVTASLSDVGGTVEGSESDQSFTTVDIDVDRENPTILQVRLKGNGETIAVSNFCAGCGRERKSGENFCPKCGSKLETSA